MLPSHELLSMARIIPSLKSRLQVVLDTVRRVWYYTRNWTGLNSNFPSSGEEGPSIMLKDNKRLNKPGKKLFIPLEISGEREALYGGCGGGSFL